MCLYDIAAKYSKLLEAAHAHIDDNRYDIEKKLETSSNWTSQISNEAVVSLLLLRTKFVWAVLMCLYDIAAKYNKLLEAAYAHIDDNR